MVAIKDMEMPKSCAHCDMTYEDRQLHDICQFNYTDVGYHISNQTKPADCPLVEIEERKVGKWEYKQLGFRKYGLVCTSCGYTIHIGYDFNSMEEFKDMIETKLQNPHITKDKYCCKCGAEMRGNEDENYII